MKPTDFRALLRRCAETQLEFIVIGGIAGMAHGQARATYDLDLLYRRNRANLELLVRALSDLHPYLRGAPPGLPFCWDLGTLRMGLNFTLTTDWGALDLLGEVAGGGTYDSVLPYSQTLELFDTPCRVVTLERLIQLKRAAGRPKDFEALAELQALLEERRKLEALPPEQGGIPSGR
jgi:predicted nucleotidyltransferase